MCNDFSFNSGHLGSTSRLFSFVPTRSSAHRSNALGGGKLSRAVAGKIMSSSLEFFSETFLPDICVCVCSAMVSRRKIAFWWNTVTLLWVPLDGFAGDSQCCLLSVSTCGCYRVCLGGSFAYVSMVDGKKGSILLPLISFLSPALFIATITNNFQRFSCKPVCPTSLSIIKSYLFYHSRHAFANVVMIVMHVRVSVAEIGSFRFIITHLLQF